jgi:CheY-like chemotaxis protein
MPLVNRWLNILLTEDNSDDVFFFQNAFKKAGGSGILHAVSDGLEALAYLTGEGAYSDRAMYPFPDVLLLDLNMPRMNGFEVLEWVRQDPTCSRLTVYILTSSSREADVQRAYELRANSYVVKPTRVDQLVAFVTTLHEWHRFIALPINKQSAKIEPQPVV